MLPAPPQINELGRFSQCRTERTKPADDLPEAIHRLRRQPAQQRPRDKAAEKGAGSAGAYRQR
jgi:hypothetical protein